MLHIGGILQFNITGNVSSPAASSTTALISPTCPSPSKLGTARCQTTLVGAAVGIPLGFLLLLSLALAFLERRRANAARMQCYGSAGAPAPHRNPKVVFEMDSTPTAK